MTKDELLKLLPVWCQRIREYPEIMKAYAQAFTELQTNLASVSDNLYLQRCDEPTLADWERLMKIYPDPGESLEVRRKHVLARWSMTGTYSLKYVQDQLDEALGAENYTLNIYFVGGVTWAVLNYLHYIEGGRDLVAVIWYGACPAHISFEQYDVFDIDVNSKLYCGGVCQTTVMITI